MMYSKLTGVFNVLTNNTTILPYILCVRTEREEKELIEKQKTVKCVSPFYNWKMFLAHLL